MVKEKLYVNIVFIGYVDYGKSIIIGRLFFDIVNILENIIKKFEEMGEKGKFFKFVWVMDRFKEERECGIIIDVVYIKFEILYRYIIIIDVLGYRDFVKNMIIGVSQVDVVVFVVVVIDGVMLQIKEYVFFVRIFGINYIIVVINKMDMVNYDEKKFKQVVEQVKKFFQMFGYKDFLIILISVWEGDNVVKKSDKMFWYNGLIFFEVFDQIFELLKLVDKLFCILIQDVYLIKGVGIVLVGCVEIGVFCVGDVVIFELVSIIFYKLIQGEVKSIEMYYELFQEVYLGDNIGFNVCGVGKNDIKCGDVVGYIINLLIVVRLKDIFKVQIIVFNYLIVIIVGYILVFYVYIIQVVVRFEQFFVKFDLRIGNIVEENLQFIKIGDLVIVIFRLIKVMVIELVKEILQMGRFVICDMGQIVVVGMVIFIQKVD